MIITHLTSSTFFGGPERQMLGLAQALGADPRTVFLSFAEGGRCQAFLDRVESEGFEALALEHDTPHFRASISELTTRLRQLRADVLCCHGYKAGLLGRLAARRAGIPVVAVSRGWTRENPKVRVYEALDRLGLRWMDRVVCVSEGQAAKVRRARVPADRVVVIRNAIRAERFNSSDPSSRERLDGLFARPRRLIVGAAGRLSPEKGFEVLIDAAVRVVEANPSAGFVLFGDGPLREKLVARIRSLGLTGTFILAGFRTDLDRCLPSLDLLVQSSYTEGLPNVILEACAAGVPVVATHVGGTPEVVEEGVTGHLVPSGDPDALARRILELAGSEARRREMGARGRERIREHFTFEAQAESYVRLFVELCGMTGATGEALLAST